MRAGEQELHGRRIDVSSVDRVLFPETGATKGDVVAYYDRIAETMLPHVEGRPTAVKRYPQGVDEPGFFQKNAGSHFPDWIHREQIPKREGGDLDHVVVDEPATLVYLANQGTIEFHPWLSRMEHLDRPDQLVFDLDPPEDSEGAAVRSAARQVRGVLDELGLTSHIKTSGSKGFHLHVPIEPTVEFRRAWQFSAGVAAVAARRHPEELTDEQRIAKRGGRIFIDHYRNRYGQTSVAPYSLRARPAAPVATPIEWDELGGVEPQSYTLDNVFRRLGQRDDPWADGWHPHRLEDTFGALAEMLRADG